MDKDTALIKVKDLMTGVFEIDEGSISPEKKLDDDLDLDSLDMVDLVITMNDQPDLLTEQIEPALFKDARTVQDIVDLLSPFFK